MAKLTTRELDELFYEAHKTGAERHGGLWLTANEFVLMKASRCGIDTSTKQNRALLSTVTLSVLDSAKRYYETEVTDDKTL